MITLDEELLVSLANAPWFQRCASGSDIDLRLPFSIRRVQNWDDALRNCSDLEWEDVTQQAQDRLTSYLSKNHASSYQGVWNGLVREARTRIGLFLDSAIEQTLDEHHLGQVFADCVRWDVLHGVMERSYARQRPPCFFKDLLTVYEAGHFPCGWEGGWPREGCLLVL